MTPSFDFQKFGARDITGPYAMSCTMEFKYDVEQHGSVLINVKGTDARNFTDRKSYRVPLQLLASGVRSAYVSDDGLCTIKPLQRMPTLSHPDEQLVVHITFDLPNGSSRKYEISHRLLFGWVNSVLGQLGQSGRPRAAGDASSAGAARNAPRAAGTTPPNGAGPARNNQNARGGAVGDNAKDPIDELAEKSGARLFLPGENDVTEDKIIGQAAAKKKLRETVEYLQDPERFAAMEARARRALLLVGGPGLGKTLSVRYVATVANAPMLVTTGSSFIEQYVGVGAGRVRALFDWARHLAKEHGRCIIFVDEIDAVGRQRSGESSNGEHQQTINALLAELDGFVQDEGILFIAATNFEKVLDEALLSRFDDSHIQYHSPTLDERAQMLGLYLPEHLRAADVDLTAVARMTRGASGRVLEKIVNEAKLKSVFAKEPKVTQALLDDAEAEVTIGAKREGSITESEFQHIAEHECGHALVAYELGDGTGEKKAPLRFTVAARGNTGGHVMQDGGDGEFGYTKKQLTNRIAVSMAGAAAVKLYANGREDTGPSGDLENATRVARLMVSLGMSKLGFVPYDTDARSVSEHQRAVIDAEVARLLKKGFKTAMQTLESNAEQFHRLVAAVIEKETILSEEFTALCQSA